MTDEDIKRLVHMNERLLLAMGFVTSIIFNTKHFVPEEKRHGMNWFLEAMENLVYLDKPLPPFQER